MQAGCTLITQIIEVFIANTFEKRVYFCHFLQFKYFLVACVAINKREKCDTKNYSTSLKYYRFQLIHSSVGFHTEIISFDLHYKLKDLLL